MNRRTLLSVAAGAAFLCVSAVAHADQAADAFNAWSAAFLTQSNGQTFYARYAISKATLDRPGGWADALAIELAEDVYQRDHTEAHRQLINTLVTSFLTHNGAQAKDWCVPVYNPDPHIHWKDGYNDDLGWMVTAVLHAYQITGNVNFLTVATDTWNCAYDRGWDTKYGGGGVWELMDIVGPTFNRPSKCALDNDPLIINGLLLYQITGDATYLAKSEGMYAWVHDKLFDGNTGEMRGCWGFTTADDTVGYLQNHDDNVYNAGTFLQAAEALYRLTGKKAYFQDALLDVTHRVTKDAILHSTDEGSGSEWAYPFIKGLSQFATFNGLWKTYETWLDNNAKAAWSKRGPLNLTWNDWTATTPDPPFLQDTRACSNKVPPLACLITPLDTRSAAGIWQFFPQPLFPALETGSFELQNAGSALSLTTNGANAEGAAIVQQPFGNTADALWTFTPTNGGYYHIQNVSSGLYLSVESNSAKPGAKIVALSAPAPGQGNEQWLPVSNSDGTYTFYNLSSILALDNPDVSNTAGTQFEQWIGNGGGGQAFRLIQHTAPGPGVDAGVVMDAASTVDASDNGDDGGTLGSDAASEGGAGSSSAPPSASGANGCSTARALSSGDLFGGVTFLAVGSLTAMRRRRRPGPKRSSPPKRPSNQSGTVNGEWIRSATS